MKPKRLLSLLLTITLALTLLPVTARAASGTGTQSDPILWDIDSDGNLTIRSVDDNNKYYIITGTTTTNNILVDNYITANITLVNVSIDVSATNTFAFAIADNATVNLTLTGTNTLKSGNGCAGLWVKKNGGVTIDGDGTLNAIGGVNCAGIGGGGPMMPDCGIITINGGTVNATGGDGAAGIGGGQGGSNSGTITIKGDANVTATGGDAAAGIGGGMGKAAGTIIITTTGAVVATGGAASGGVGKGANIGWGGQSGGVDGTVLIPMFSAAGSVDLNSPTDLVITPESGGTVTGNTLTKLWASRPGGVASDIFNMPTPPDVNMADLIEFDGITKELTIKEAAFGTHTQQALAQLPPGTYYLAIVLDNINYYYAEITIIDSTPIVGGFVPVDNRPSGSFVTVNTVQVPYILSGGAVSSAPSAQSLRDIVDKAYVREDGGKAVKLDYSGVSGAQKLTLTLDASDLNAGEDVTFIVETPFGTFIFTTEQMLKWFGGEELGTYVITLEKSSLKVDVKKDGKSAEWNSLTPMARIGVPGADNLAITDKTGRVLPTSVYESGMVFADIFAPGTYKAEAVAAEAFADTAEHWAQADIGYVTLRGLLSGAPGGFAPDAPVTRADFITALVRLAGVDVSGYTESRYSDVSGAAVPYIEWAAETELVFGVGDGLFQPERSITREEMAVMMYRFAGALGYPLPVLVSAETFGDAAEISAWAQGAASAMQRAGIVEGKPGSAFDPAGTFTRAESAAVLHRFIEQVISSRNAEGWSNANSDLNKRVYYTRGGVELTGWQELAGKRYYFGKDGVLAVNTVIDGFDVGADGARKGE